MKKVLDISDLKKISRSSWNEFSICKCVFNCLLKLHRITISIRHGLLDLEKGYYYIQTK